MKPKNLIRLQSFFTILCITGILLLPHQGFCAKAQKAVIGKVTLNNTRDDLIIYYKVRHAFNENVIKRIESGADTTFSFRIVMKEVIAFRKDKKIHSLKHTHSIKYNNLKKEYVIHRSWEDNKPIITKSFSEAKKLMTEIKGLKIASLKELKKGQTYSVITKAQLNKVTLPLKLHYVLFFVSLWDFETDWYSVEFIY